MNTSISRGRAALASGSPPASRIAAYLATVFASHPVSCAADQAVPVRPNASKISTISLPDLVMGPSGHRWVRRITQTHPHRRDHSHHDTPDTGREPATDLDRRWPQDWRNDGRQPGANSPHTLIFSWPLASGVAAEQGALVCPVWGMVSPGCGGVTRTGIMNQGGKTASQDQEPSEAIGDRRSPRVGQRRWKAPH